MDGATLEYLETNTVSVIIFEWFYGDHQEPDDPSVASWGFSRASRIVASVGSPWLTVPANEAARVQWVCSQSSDIGGHVPLGR
jgi:hypothetical protein